MLGVLLAVAAPLSATAPVVAQTTPAGDDEEARRLFEGGLEALQREDYATALVAFQRAYDLSARPVLLYNIGMCQRALLRFPQAIEAFQKYLVESSGDSAAADLRLQVVELIAEMESGLSTVTVLVNVDGAILYLDGEQVGGTPLARPLRIGPGSHVLEARRDGYRDARMPFDIMAGEDTQVQLNLEQLSSTGPQPPVGPTTPPDDDDGSVASEWWFWTIIGVVVAGGAVTAGVLLWPEPEEPAAAWSIHGQ